MRCLLVTVATAYAILLPRAAQAEPFSRINNIAYGTASTTQALDLYLPTRTTTTTYPATPRPVVIWVHGGGWNAGSKANPPVLSMLPDGVALASIDYRLTPEAPFPAQIQDLNLAIRYLRATAAEHNLDPNRFGIIGSTAGAHLAALAALAPEEPTFVTSSTLSTSAKVSAACLVATPSDLESLFPNTPAKFRPMLEQFLGGPVASGHRLMKLGSPQRYIHAGAPPILLIHGAADTTVPPSQSEVFYRSLLAAQVDAKLVILPDQGHQVIGNTALVGPHVRNFLAAHLRPTK